MLFFNFLCLFYLMVLINGHTISKNKDYREELDKTHDSLNDLDYKREYMLGNGGLRHIHRREDKKEAALAPQKKTTTTTKTTKPTITTTTRTKKVSVVVSTLVSENTISPRNSFWKKIRQKWIGDKEGNKKDSLYLRKRKVSKRGKHYRQYGIDTQFISKEDAFEDARVPKPDVDRRRNRYKSHTDKRKREASQTTTTFTPSRLSVTFPKDSRNTTRKATTRSMGSMTNNIISSKLGSIKNNPSTKSLSEALREMTSQISTLKQTYGLTFKENPFVHNTEIPLKETVTVTVTPTPSTTTELDFPGTAQIEALLNDIKIKAVEMVAQQNPAITDIITNTVTETTFEADPILTHVGWNTKNYALTSFISIDIPPNNKRTVDSNETVVIANTEPTHNIEARSIQEDMYTAAHSIENMLQKKLKKMYRKVKGKMSCQLKSEIDQVTSITKAHSRKVTTKMNKALSKPKCKPHALTTPTSTSIKNTGKQIRRSNKNKQVPNQFTATTAPSYLPTLPTTFDDYMMLTLFEHILARTHQDNVMKMLATTEASGPFVKRNYKQKREDKAATSIVGDGDTQFQEYTDVGDYFYSSLPTLGRETSSLTTMSNAYTSTASTEDTSYEGLSNKISFNDYVNGYKHYLKFQKEQGEQKFSNLVRYQAHKHHSVDDIGKFILNKIPQLPTVRDKRFLVDYNVEDESSTKSFESWFKKHFYFFNDNNTPKKFHTSQTVELKSPISSLQSTLGKSSTITNAVEDTTNKKSSESTEVNLDLLSNDFYKHKSLESLPTYDTAEEADVLRPDITEPNKEQTPDPEQFRVHEHISFIKRMFGSKNSDAKRGTTPTKDTLNEESQMEPNEYNENEDPQRDKRNLNEDAKGNAKYPTTSLKVTTQRSLTDKKNKSYGYVDVNLIPRPKAIVKLRENKSKKGCMKKFFNKFRFHKHKEDKKKTKRENRMPRFNPLKKFRELLRGKGHAFTYPDRDSSRDEAILTTRIDTFKSIKYDKMPSVEEMSLQVPNITGDEESNSALNKNKFAWDQEPFKYTVEDNPAKETSSRYSNDLKDSRKTNKETQHKAQHLDPKAINFESLEKKLKATTADDNFATISYHIPVTIKSFRKLNNDNFKTPTVSVRFTNNRKPSKFKVASETYDSSPLLFEDAVFPFTTPTDMTLVHYTPNKNTLAVTPHRMYIPPHLQNFEEDMDDIKIHSKVSRLVKFALPHLNDGHTPKNVEVIDAPSTNMEFTTINYKDFKRDIDQNPSLVALTTDKDIHKNPLRSANSRPSFKQFPDYFNDLLMWHGDLLNTDKITTATWEKVMESIGVASKPTDSSINLQNEIQYLNEFLQAYGMKSKGAKKERGYKTKKDKVRSNDFKFKPRKIIKTVAFQDDTIAKADGVMVKARANYLKIAKQPSLETKPISPIFMNEEEKMYFKPYAKVRNAKFDESFWKGRVDPGTEQPSEDNSEIFLDTTLLAYDDGPDSLTHRPVDKKVSKNSLGSFDLGNIKLPLKSITKTNQSPMQYFSTPLPMRINDFEQFLRENNIDVQSVTTPLNMPQLMSYSKKRLTAKPTPTPSRAVTRKNIKAMKKLPSFTTESDYPPFSKKMKTIQLTAHKNDDNQLFEPSLYLTENENGKANTEAVRDKRFRIKNDIYLTHETRITPAMKKKKKPKKKRKFNERKLATESSYSDVLEKVYISPTPDSSDIELTIINLDDLDLKSTQKHSAPKFRDSWSFLHKAMPVSMNGDTAADKKNRDTTKRKVATMTETLLSASKDDDRDEMTVNVDANKPRTVLPLVLSLDENTEDKTQLDSSTSILPSIDNIPFNENNPFLLQRKNHHPKRIKISSHNYKYDIIYHVNKRSKRSTVTPSTTTYIEVDINEQTNDTISFIHSTRNSKLGRDIKIIRIVKAVEAVENFTRPNVIIHIDLPTYYAPYTGATEPIVTRKPKGIWNDVILKYLSGIALVELLNKFGIIKADGYLNFTDGVDNAVNATEVFSRPESNDGQDVSYDTKQQQDRQVPVRPQFEINNISRFQEFESLQPNWREKRRLKILSHIKGKLKNLLHKTPKHANASVTPVSSTGATSLTPAIAGKIKREKVDEWKNDQISKNSLPIVYNLDVDKIVEKATSFDDILTIKMDQIKKDADLSTPITSLPDSVQIQSIPTTLLVTDLDVNGLHSKDEVHYEGQPNILQMYNDQKLLRSTKANIIQDAPITEISGTKLGKRDTSQKFTAKDVAAIEVIVDLVKNTVNVDGLDSLHQSFNNFLLQPTTPFYNPGTNNIQVHVAIPYSFDKKRDLENMKVRKVFAAKMDKPVDLEYQVHAWENPVIENPSKPFVSDLVNNMVTNVNSNVNINKTLPKLYLLVDNSGALAQGNYALKPVTGDIDLSKVKVRQAESTKVFEQVGKIDKTTTVATPNTINKVTLSKDFVAAINKHLVQLYENLTSFNRSAGNHVKVRKAEQFEPIYTKNEDKMKYRRHINWEAIKRFFGHDRVCNCKCKPNRTMCRACAASDAVINELIFEFDNLAKYMSDHCTEIQTFFWMNPSGGKKLRDSVHKVDQSLHDYYKRIKGKCQGRKCNTFSTCIDKRSIADEKIIPRKYIGNVLISDIQRIAKDIDTATKYRTCFNKQLIAEGQKLVDMMNDCVRPPRVRNKLEIETSRRPMFKNVYSVDNINVNIICQPTDTEVELTEMTDPTFTTNSFFYADTIGTEYNSYVSPEKKRKVHKNLSRLFSRRQPNEQAKKNNLFTYYVMNNGAVSKPMNVFQKRQIQTEVPFLSDKDDTRTQMEDYLKTNDIQKRVIRESYLDKEFETTTVETSLSALSSESLITAFPTFASTIDHMLVNSNPDKDPSIENLSYNINELFKIFHNLTDLNEVKYLSTSLNSYDKTKKTTKKPKTTKKTAKKTKAHKSTLHKHKQTFHKTSPKHKSSSKHKTVAAVKETAAPRKTSFNATKPHKITTKAFGPKQVSFKPESKSDVFKKPQKDSKETLATSQKDFKIETTVTKESALDKQLNTLDSLLSPKVTKPSNDIKGSTSSKDIQVSSATTPSDMSSVSKTPDSSLPTTTVGTKTTDAINATSIMNTNDDSSSTDTTYTPSNYTTQSFLQRLKSVSIDFFYNRFKTTASTKEKLQFIRSHVTESMSKKEEIDKNMDVTSPSSYPTIIILNDYTDDWSSMYAEENYTLPSIVKEAKQKDLLLSILDYEAKKLNYEWRRYKKENRMDRQYFATTPFIILARTTTTAKATTEPHFEIKDEPSSKDVYYDVMSHATEIGKELPTPPGFETTEKKDQSLIQKFVNRFQIKHTSCYNKLTPPTRKRPKRPRSHRRSSVPKPTLGFSPRSRRRTRLRTKNSKNTEGVISDHTVQTTYFTEENPFTARITHQTTQGQMNESMEATIADIQDPKLHHKLLCDIEATFEHVKKLQTNMSKEHFEEYVKHIKCYKYYKIPRYFLIEFRNGRRDDRRRQTDRYRQEERRRIKSDRKFKWDWIRNKRSVDFNETDTIDDEINNFVNETYLQDDYNFDRLNLNHNDRKEEYISDTEQSFETFYKDSYGVYRRKKRSLDDVKVLEAAIKDIPLQPGPHETYVMFGDSAIIHCSSGNASEDTTHNETAKWKTNRKDMLFYKNVAVRGKRLVINKAEPKNQGVYVCRKGDALEKNVKLTVITLPTYEVVSTLLYSVDNSCTYNDLKTALPIGKAMSQECCPSSECCSVRVEEPVCLRDQSGSAQLRLTAVLSAPPRQMACSARCRRDAHASLALLAARNAPALASVPVLIANRGINKTLVPLIPKHKMRFIVTHTLRKKDTTHRKFRGVTPAPGGVRVDISCPAGYYLETRQKICVACPSGTYSRYGDNSCARCSRGTGSQPGEGRCHFIRRRTRRYNWWWGGSAGAAWLAAFVCAALAALRLRARSQRRQCNEDVVALPVTSIKRNTPTPRPLSPSRVILTKFFRGSRSSTKATDSQETKFGLWKEKNMPPPLPPIDFDI